MFCGNVKSGQKFFCVAFRVPSAEFGKLVFEIRRPYAVFVGKVFFLIERVFFVHNIDEPLMSEHNRPYNGFVVVCVLVLFKHRHTLVFIQRNLAFLRFEFARKYFQKGGFARAVRADDAVAVTFREFDIYVFKKFSAAELQAYSVDL